MMQIVGEPVRGWRVGDDALNTTKFNYQSINTYTYTARNTHTQTKSPGVAIGVRKDG